MRSHSHLVRIQDSLCYRNMKQVCFAALVLLGAELSVKGNPFALETLPADQRASLTKGEVIVLSCRPDEEAAEVDSRFVSVAKLISGSREMIWEVIHDKEDAELFLDGVLESRVIKETENEIIVEQRTHVGGPKGDYLYRLRHRLTPHKRSDFTYIDGEIRNVLGSWWIFDGATEDTHLVVYSLHIDPGVFAPQFVVKRGMKKSMPGTVRSIQKEVKRRSELTSKEKGDSPQP